MTIGRRIIGSISGMLTLLAVLAGTGIGVMAWLRSWHDGFVESAQASGALTDPGLQDMLHRLDYAATVITIIMGVVLFLCVGLGVTALVRLGPTVDRKFRSVATGLRASVSHLLKVASDMAESSSRTAAATAETTATVEEVKQATMLASGKASDTSELADAALKGTQFGQAAAEKNQQHFHRIQESMDHIADAMARLGEQVQSVGDVMTTVSDLAEQSKLLAVNASIEAVKAGEAGRGFTVVAQEVKSLAEQSKRSVAQVRTVLVEVQKASAEVADAIEGGRETAGTGTSDAERALSKVGARVEASRMAHEATVQISATSRQQLAGVEQIEQAVLSIDQSGQRSLANSREVEEEVRRLQELADSLERLLGGVLAKAS